jgi:hypothetical protein
VSAALVERVREQAGRCALAGSRLMDALLSGAADDLATGLGPVHDLLAPLEGDPAGTVPPLRFAGALHRLVLTRRAPRLAMHYPSVGGTAPVGDVWPAAREAVAEHVDALRSEVTRTVQTNEVGRSAVLLGGLQAVSAEAPLPVALLEVGASGGLNLLVDRFAVRVDGALRGDPASPLVLEEPWSGPAPPDVPVRVAERAGCDPDPLDPRSTEGRLVLTSFVWPDQLVRLARLRAALAVAADLPVRVERAPASQFLARELAAPRPGRRTVVWHSVVRQYMTPAERAAVDALLEQAGARATPEAPLVRLGLEPERDPEAGYPFRLRAQTWPGGQVRVLAEADGHGPPVVWR